MDLVITTARGSFQEDQKVKPGSDFPWILAYRPIRSCHRVLKDKYGEFSPPAYCGDSPTNLWCNWTIWAGSRKHIIIYIQGFISGEGCNKNEDKILFEGVSSLVENSVVYACWKKETHVFATFAQAVHIVLLKRYLPDCRERQFKGKYYVFQDQKDESSFEVDVISKTPAPKLPKKDSIFQSRWAEEFRDVQGFVTTRSTVSLGKTPVLSGGLLQGRGSTLGTAAVGSPVELVTYEGARTLLMETKAPCMPGSELQGVTKYFKEAQGRGTPWGTIPAAEQDTWSQSLSMSRDITVRFGYMDGLSSELLETPLLDALQVVEPLLQQAGVGLEDRQAILHPTLRPKHLGDLQFTIKPTPTSCLDLPAFSQTLLTGRRESTESRVTTISPVSLEKDQSHSQPSALADVTVSSDADGLAKGLISSLSSLYEVVNEDHSQLLPETSQRWQISLEDLSMIQPELGTTGLQHTKLMGIFSMEHFRGVVERKAVLHLAASWDIFQEHPHLCVQSSHVLHSAPKDPGSLSQNALGRDHPATEEAHVSSLGLKSCHHQSYRAAQPELVVPTSPTGLEHVPTAKSTLGTETIHVLMVSFTESVPADFSSTDFTSQAHPPPEAKPVSPIVFSPPAALDLDHANLRQRVGVSLAGPGEQEMVSPSPPCHLPATSGPGTDESPGCLHSGMQKLVLEEADGQQAETSAPVGLTAKSPSPASAPSPNLGVGLPWPEGYVSSGAGVAPASRPGIWGARREEHVVPLQHQGTVASDELVSPSVLEEFKMQKTTEALQAGAGQQRNASFSATSAQPRPSVAQGVETVSRGQKSQEPSDDPLSRNVHMPGGQQWKHAELGLPWAMEYFPIRSCHIIFQDGSGIFYLPLHVDVEANIWCNWTIMAGSQKHIVIYVQGFQGNNGCGKNQDKIIFQGVKSSVETKVVYACHNQGTLIFATQATAVHVLFLSGSSYVSREYRHFKGWYYVFKDSEIVGSSNDNVAPRKPVQEVSREESWRTTVTKSLMPMLRASPGSSGAPAGGRIQPELVSPDNKPRHSPDHMKDAQSGANLSKLDLNECGQPWDVTELERSLKDDSTEDRESEDDILLGLSLAGQDTGHKAELFALEIAEGDVELVPAVVTVAPCCSAGISSSEVPSSNAHASAKSSSLDQASDSLSEEVVTAAHCMQTPLLEEPPLNTSTTPSPLYPSPGITAGHVVSPGIKNEEFFGKVFLGYLWLNTVISISSDAAFSKEVLFVDTGVTFSWSLW
ncbi:uncharacterized protein [Phaenicophaeus curvirostris]|uniref:uncharacterized protein n=1 Tax=Phaenicophaeus curvirostris TaxID=33595 RepID=UPI0037F0B737